MYYEEPILEVEYFHEQDVLTTSMTESDWDDNINPWE